MANSTETASSSSAAPQLSACCRAVIGWDAWVDSNGEVCGGPYDNSQCMGCGQENPQILPKAEG